MGLFGGFLFVVGLTQVCGNMDLYLAESEVMKLMGMSAQLYYVRQGLVNEYATKYVIPVPNSIASLSFMWQHSVAAGRDMQYTITILHEDSDALTTDLNISKVGIVPTSPMPFVVQFKCSGTKSAEVEVLLNIQLHNSRLPSNTTELVIKRRKTCLKTTPTANYHAEQPSAPAPAEHPNGMTVLGIGLGIAVGIVTLLFVLVLCSKQNPHSKRAATSDTHSGHMAEERNGTTTITAAASNTVAGDQTDATDENLYRRKIAELTLQRCRVRLSSLVQEGTFGKVYRGTYNDSEEVLVKTASDQASPLQISLFLKDGMGLYGASHPHIHSVLGVSIDHTAPYLLYPAPMNTRNLKLFLQDNTSVRLSTVQVVAVALQLCQALEHLHRHGLVHRDVATRNCVTDDQLNVKLSDNSLARDLFPNDYCCLGDSENRPIRYMAIESIQANRFSEASDSWAYGVFVWELCTRAALPYAEIDPFEMEHYLSDGFRLTQPKNCPDELFAIIAYCWSLSPMERPTFTALEFVIRDFYTQIARYV